MTFLITANLSCSLHDPLGWVDEHIYHHTSGENWYFNGGDFKQPYYSTLNQIHQQNVSQLGFAWEFDASSKIGNIGRGLEATPVVVDGTLFTSGAWGAVYSIDAKTGQEIWTYQPQVDATYNQRACCDVVNRGVAVWKGKVYVGTLDGYLVCLDAASGEVVWKTDTFTDRSISYTITGAPTVAGDVVVIGNSGAEFGVRGYITAYHLETGEEAWRFYTVPGDPSKGFEHPELEMAAATWDPDSYWEAGGGGTVWGQMNYDPQLDLLYVGTGNSSPYPIWFRSPEGGDNLFLCSILAIDPQSGRLAWHYQTTPGEIWDYTSTQNMILAELKIEGDSRKVLMQAPKNGFFYVLDRETGELISAEKYSLANWASHVDIASGRPVLTGEAWYKDEPKYIIPSMSGAHNWNPMSYSSQSGLVYIPETIFPMIYGSVEHYEYSKLTLDVGLGVAAIPPFPQKFRHIYKDKADTVIKNKIKAWDPVGQQAVWEVELPVAGGNGGMLSTAGGLLFSGTNTGYLRVYNAQTGELLKELFTGTAIMAAPMTYLVDGEQYVAVMAGFGGTHLAHSPTDKRAIFHKYQNYGRLLAFKLGAGETPIPPAVQDKKVPNPPQKSVDLELIPKGKALFKRYCSPCHMVGPSLSRYSHYPNLAQMSVSTHAIFEEIVLKGAYSTLGMARFDDKLKSEDVEAIHQYLLSAQISWWKLQNDPATATEQE